MSNKVDSKRLSGFKKDLKDLLAKYDASLSFSYDGDSHGIHDEKITVSFLMPLKKGSNFRTWSDDVAIGDQGTVTKKDV